MSAMNTLWRRLSMLVGRERFSSELDEEMIFHRTELERQLVEAGVNGADASRAARKQLGNRLKLRDQSHDVVAFRFETVWQDLRYAVRQLYLHPSFTIVITLTLALSIGANSAIFSVVDAVLLKSLPYPQADRLMRVFLSNDAFPQFPLNPWDFHDYRSRSQSFESMAAYTRADKQLSGSGQPVQLSGFAVTAGYFHTLGLTPQLGREFDAKAEIPGNETQVILSDRLWRSRFNADPSVLGRKVTLEMKPYTIVGVMPRGTQHPGNGYRAVAYGNTVDVWTPFPFAGDPGNRGSHYIEGLGRLRPGVAPAQAQAELNTIMKQIEHEHGDDSSTWKVLAIPLYEEIVGTNQRMLWVLLGAVGMVLLIACANAANLLLARAAGRQREIAVRMALGAPRTRLIRQMMTESLLISLLGGGLGLGLAFGGVKALVAMLPAGFPRAAEIHVSAPVFAFTLLISVAVGLLFGLAPAFQASRTDPKQGLYAGGRGATGSNRQRRLRNVLVISEVSLACVLLIGAGLMLRSFLNQLQENPGFAAERVFTATLSLPRATYTKPVEAASFYDRLLLNLSALPEVGSVGLGSDLPWTGYDDNSSFNIEGKQPPPHEDFTGRYHSASPDYFRALGIPLMKGRYFRTNDEAQSPKVVILNQALATRYWPNEDPVGHRIAFEDKPAEKDWIRIVGVVGDVKDKPSSPSAHPAYWFPLAQLPLGAPTTSLVMRSNASQQLIANAVREQLKRLDPSLALADVRMMDEVADQGISTARFAFVLVGLFAGLAIVLAAIGIYGVIAYSVSQRIPEFGLRLALGAPPASLMRQVLGQAAKLATVGTVLGLIAALALSRIVRSLVYGVSASDPRTFSIVALGVITIAILACYLPARRATRTNPIIALKEE